MENVKIRRPEPEPREHLGVIAIVVEIRYENQTAFSPAIYVRLICQTNECSRPPGMTTHLPLSKLSMQEDAVGQMPCCFLCLTNDAVGVFGANALRRRLISSP